MLTTNQDSMSIGFPMLSELKDRHGFDQWMIIRIHGADCVVLETLGHEYDIAKGMVFKLDRSIQPNLLSFSQPKVVPNVASENDPLPLSSNHLPIRSYLHLPIINKEHHFFGALCAISSQPQPFDMTGQIDDINNTNQVICKKLDDALKASEIDHAENRKKVAHDIDPMTMLYNWHGWEKLLDSEEARCQTFGYLGDIITIELTGLTEHTSTHGGESTQSLLKQIATVLKDTVSESSFIARVGSSEFVICTIDNDIEPIEDYGNKIAQALKEKEIMAFVGYARSIPNKGLRDAWEHAEHMLYKLKSNALIS